MRIERVFHVNSIHVCHFLHPPSSAEPSPIVFYTRLVTWVKSPSYTVEYKIGSSRSCQRQSGFTTAPSVTLSFPSTHLFIPPQRGNFFYQSFQQVDVGKLAPWITHVNSHILIFITGMKFIFKLNVYMMKNRRYMSHGILGSILGREMNRHHYYGCRNKYHGNRVTGFLTASI